MGCKSSKADSVQDPRRPQGKTQADHVPEPVPKPAGGDRTDQKVKEDVRAVVEHRQQPEQQQQQQPQPQPPLLPLPEGGASSARTVEQPQNAELQTGNKDSSPCSLQRSRPASVASAQSSQAPPFDETVFAGRSEAASLMGSDSSASATRTRGPVLELPDFDDLDGDIMLSPEDVWAYVQAGVLRIGSGVSEATTVPASPRSPPKDHQGGLELSLTGRSLRSALADDKCLQNALQARTAEGKIRVDRELLAKLARTSQETPRRRRSTSSAKLPEQADGARDVQQTPAEANVAEVEAEAAVRRQGEAGQAEQQPRGVEHEVPAEVIEPEAREERRRRKAEGESRGRRRRSKAGGHGERPEGEAVRAKREKSATSGEGRRSRERQARATPGEQEAQEAAPAPRSEGRCSTRGALEVLAEAAAAAEAPLPNEVLRLDSKKASLPEWDEMASTLKADVEAPLDFTIDGPSSSEPPVFTFAGPAPDEPPVFTFSGPAPPDVTGPLDSGDLSDADLLRFVEEADGPAEGEAPRSPVKADNQDLPASLGRQHPREESDLHFDLDLEDDLEMSALMAELAGVEEDSGQRASVESSRKDRSERKEKKEKKEKKRDRAEKDNDGGDTKEKKQKKEKKDKKEKDGKQEKKERKTRKSQDVQDVQDETDQ